jgi:hypothetical protein
VPVAAIDLGNFHGHDMCASGGHAWTYAIHTTGSVLGEQLGHIGPDCPHPMPQEKNDNTEDNQHFGLTSLINVNILVNCTPHPTPAGQRAIAAAIDGATPDSKSPPPAAAVRRGADVAGAAQSTTITGAAKSLTSSTGVRLTLSVSAFREGKHAGVSVAVTRKHAGGEQHSWTFPLRPHALHVSASTAKLATGQSLGRYGKLRLDFHRSHSKTLGCIIGSGSQSTGPWQGSLRFATGTKWGTLTGKHLTLHAQRTTQRTCLSPPSSPACSSSTQWGSIGSTAGAIDGSGERRSATVSLSRRSQLSKPSGASRIDLLSTTADPLKRHGQQAKSRWTVAAEHPHQVVTGRASLTGTGKPSISSVSCGRSGKREETSTAYAVRLRTHGAHRLLGRFAVTSPRRVKVHPRNAYVTVVAPVGH